MKTGITINKVEESQVHTLDLNNLVFGKTFSDHMFMADYIDGEWRNLEIKPFGHLPMHPAMTSIHYGQSIFEGLKARKNSKGKIIVFRPEMNWKRMNKSAARMAMPQIPEELFFNALDQLLRLDEGWIPSTGEASLYIRPFMFATDEFIGIKKSNNYKFMIFTCPVGAYYSTPVKVYASEKYTRAFPGGTGFAKTSGNYAATIQPVQEIHKMGFDQILWLDGIEKKYLQEIGTMNFFIVINGKVLTPDSDEGTILEGITRDSVLQLLKKWNIPTEVRKISINELLEAHANNTIEDAFGAGTAATISQISTIGYRDTIIEIPERNASSLSIKLKAAITAIKNGEVPDTYNWLRTIQLETVHS